jgi:Cryptococcal mannosyltransferase 1/Glycosyl transferase family 2
MKMKFLLLFFQVVLFAAPIEEKVLICGVCKDIEHAVSNTIQSIEELGAQFQDYYAIIYENNSKDHTKALLQDWADQNSHVLFLSETLSDLTSPIHKRKMRRTEAIARARNCVMDHVQSACYDDYKYVIWADLDFLMPWDVENIVDSILNPQQEWDAILANGMYDLFAYRDEEFPIGAELMGEEYWNKINCIAPDLQGWKRVYSAFGGLGIYKRDAIKNFRYSGLVTRDVEKAIIKWLEKADDQTFLHKKYQKKMANAKCIDLCGNVLPKKPLPKNTGVRLLPPYGEGKLVWFSPSKSFPLPWTCEHITLHATMALNGYDKLYVNPQLISNP